jgi:hypothetical protein
VKEIENEKMQIAKSQGLPGFSKDVPAGGA